MNSRIRAVAIFLVIVLLLPALAQAGGTVPKGTAISVVTDQTVSSKTAKVGQPVTGSVAKDVTVGGKVVIPKGSPVKLSVNGQEGHQVPCRDKTRVHHTNRRRDQVEPTPRAKRRLSIEGGFVCLGNDCQRDRLSVPPRFSRKCCI